MRRLSLFLVLFAASAGLSFSLVSGRLWPDLRWAVAGPELEWPTIEAYDFEFDLRRVGHFEGRVSLQLSGVEGSTFTLLLNRNLDVEQAAVDGQAVDVTHTWPLRSRYHSEGRVVRFELPSDAPEGRVTLDLTYAGAAESGREGSDWRGILFVDEDEARMCEQTIFYPQVPLSLTGSAVAKAPFRMTVLAPAAWELFVPAPGGLEADVAPTRTWTFVAERARHPSILGGQLERTEAEVDGSRIVTLLRGEHAHLAAEFVDEAARAVANFSARFGPAETGVIGIVEIRCRDSSYNWASEGVMAFDRGALSGSVPVAKVAHEVAHLWWGQGSDATGPGERFLTEGLAEYSSWSYLLDDGRHEAVQWNIAKARTRVAELTAAGDSLALAEVAFGVRDYTTLAYGKGALVLSNLRAQLGPGELDRALRRLIELGAERQIELVDFEAALRAASGRGDLRVPWLAASGDVALKLEDPRVEGTRLTATIVARSVPDGAAIDPRGAPVALRLGGRGWAETLRRGLTGARTEVRFELGERELAYLRLDPGDAWTGGVEDGSQVLDGARLVAADPPLGATVEFGGTRLRLEFDRRLEAVTLEDLERAQLGSPSDGFERFGLRSAALSEDGRALNVETAVWLPDRQYELALTGLVDTDGLPVAAHSYALEIAPSTDRELARIVATSPEVGAEIVAPDGRASLSITFDEAMRAGQAITTAGVRDVERRGYRYPELDGFGVWDEAQRTITYRLEDLEVGGVYALPIRERSFHDLSGNGCQSLDVVFTVVEGR